MKQRIFLSLQQWLKLSLIAIAVVANSQTKEVKQKLNATLTRINLLPIVESFYEFLDDLPLWFY